MKEINSIEDLKNRIAELEQEKNQLLKLVSHDLKSPFNKLFALTNLLQLVSNNLNEEQQDYLIRMEWVIKEGISVVRNLMDLRAIENNAIELSVEKIQLELIIDDSFKNYSKQSLVKKLEIKSNLDKVTIWSDKRLLERVVDHLISNAIKFTPKEDSISAKLIQNDAGNVFSISSNSGPIPVEEIQNLFKRSSPLSTRPTHGESALGNGLFIAQSFTHRLSGKIAFDQKESIIEFSLILPEKLLNQ